MIPEVQASYNVALKEASENGLLDVVEYLISNGADINSLCKNIHVIAQNGHLNIIKFFAEKKLDFHYENDKPLRIAAEYGQLDVVKYLVSIGLDINKESSYCIKKASENGHIDVVEFLIQKGANIKFIRSSKIRNYLGIPKWFQKPQSMTFRNCSQCSISGIELNKNVIQLGCSSCRNVFQLEALEKWLDVNYRCPCCNRSDDFYLVDN